MPIPNEHIEAVAANVRRHVTDELDRGRDAEACDVVCRHVVGVIEAEFEAHRAEGAGIACAPGCTFCCHLRVGVFAHEAVALLHYLRTHASRDEAAAIEERIVSNARRIDGTTPADHYAARLPCAFLVRGRCAAYDVRPSACARYHSMSRARCEYSYEHPRAMGTPQNSRPALLELQELGAAVDSATEASLVHAGLSAAKAELHQLLRTMIEEPSVVDRWRAGEDIVSRQP
jgi:Fe-S-cluster containining protein